METDIFPLSACLVARPDTSITLCSSPTIERDNERTGIVPIIRHDMTYIGYTIQTERITGTDPCHICFQYTHTSVTYLFHYIALQKGTDFRFRMQIRLCPESDLHSILMSIIRQVFQVLNIAIQRFGLSVSGTVPIVR